MPPPYKSLTVSLLLSFNGNFDPQDEHMPQLHNRLAYLSSDFMLAWRGGDKGLVKMAGGPRGKMASRTGRSLKTRCEEAP